MSTESYFDRFAPYAERRNHISPELHSRFNTKRGLRNADGTGVLIGLTEIGEVHGYIIDDQDRIPDNGRLSYRGVNVSDIVRGYQADGRLGFEEVVYLLLYGDLPTSGQLDELRALLGSLRSLPDGFWEDMILRAPSQDIMNGLGRSVLAAYSYDGMAEDLSVANVLRQVIELIARFPAMVAYGYQAKRHYYDGDSLVIHSPEPTLSTAENLLLMIRPDRAYTRLEAETLDLALVLHAEHGGGNNSAFTIHVVSSAATDTYSAIAAGVGSLKGLKHGGAAAMVRAMMLDAGKEIKDWRDDDEIEAHLGRLLNREAFDRSGLIYGIGHAVYTLSDPRAILLEEKAAALAEEAGRGDEFALHRAIARLAPEVLRRHKPSAGAVAPNVDFYSGFVYSTLGIPAELYTPIFAVSRIAGWSAHRIEELVSGGRIVRPAYKNVVGRVAYTPMDKRS